MKKRKIILSIIAILLALVSFLVAPMQTFAEANVKYYIEDIMIISGNIYGNALSLAPDDYAVIYTPIYDGGRKEGDERAKRSYIAYKVTTDPSKAITDIKALNMNAPWDYDAYNQYLAQIKVEMAEEADALAEAIYEFQNNWGEDLPKSNYVYEILQYLYDDKSKSRVGDLFINLDLMNAAKDDKSKLVNILLMSNAQCINVIYNALTLSCSETNTYNFLDIISDTGFKAKTYINETQYASMAQDIIDTISVTQEELKKYEKSMSDEEAIVFTVPTDAKMKAVYDALKQLRADDQNGAAVFDQYIRLVLGTDPAALNPSEKRIMIETGLANVVWYAMDSENFTSMNDVYNYMQTIILAFMDGKITADQYNEKINQTTENCEKNKTVFPKYFEDFLHLCYYDTYCYDQHLRDIAENRTGEQLYNILTNCAYHGYNNEYKNLYELVMAHDMTVPEEKRNGKYELSDFYPIIAQLSPGQRGMLKTGILNLILSVEITEEEYKKSFEYLEELIEELANDKCFPSNGNKQDPCYSIYENTDESLFVENSGVAMMQSAIDHTQKEYLNEESKSAYSTLYMAIGIFCGATGAIAGVTSMIAGSIALSAQKTMLVYEELALFAKNAERMGMGYESGFTMSQYSSQAAKTSLVNEMLAEESAATYGSLSARSMIAQTVSKVFTYVFAVIMIVMTIVLTVLAIISIFHKIGSNDYLEIPRAVCAERDICTYTVNLNGEVSVDRHAKGLVYYYGVKNPRLTSTDASTVSNVKVDPGIDPTGNDLTKYQVADVANWSQIGERQWIALYTTKSINVGSPILADSLVIDGDNWVANANTVSIFDETKPCDMQYYLHGVTSEKYLHYKVDETYNPYKAAEDKVNNTTASVFAEPSTYVVGGTTLILGLGVGCGITVFAQKKRKNENT